MRTRTGRRSGRNGRPRTPRATEHGEIWWADVEKRRPVIVVSRDDLRGARRRTTIAVVTRRVRGLPSEVSLDRRDGLPSACVANCDELQTIEKGKLLRRIGRLNEAKLAELREALVAALQLE